MEARNGGEARAWMSKTNEAEVPQVEVHSLLGSSSQQEVDLSDENFARIENMVSSKRSLLDRKSVRACLALITVIVFAAFLTTFGTTDDGRENGKDENGAATYDDDVVDGAISASNTIGTQSNEIRTSTKWWTRSNSNFPPRKIDWLHIPKTGTSFLLSLVMYNCDGKVHSSNPHAERRKIMEQYNAVKNGGERVYCHTGIRYYHSPLKEQADLGHSSFKSERVVTIIRKPIDRVASGFIDNFHTCLTITRQERLHTPSPGHMCRVLRNPESTPEEIAEIRKFVVRYANCVKGCGTRMMTGTRCGHDVEHRLTDVGDDYAEQHLQVALDKMRTFAFVGLTDRWVESMCLWREQFPRPTGGAYLVNLTDTNVRPSGHKGCESVIKQILTEEGYEDPYDEALYEMANNLFNEALERNPHCKVDPMH